MNTFSVVARKDGSSSFQSIKNSIARLVGGEDSFKKAAVAAGLMKAHFYINICLPKEDSGGEPEISDIDINVRSIFVKEFAIIENLGACDVMVVNGTISDGSERVSITVHDITIENDFTVVGAIEFIDRTPASS